MTIALRHWLSLVIIAPVFIIGAAQAQTIDGQGAISVSGSTDQHGFRFFEAPARPRSGFSLMTPSRKAGTSHQDSKVAPMAGANLQVFGGGTIGRVTKWTGFNSFSFIGDSAIFEDKNGLVGIGTDSPTSKLTVAGTIQITQGGLKFPDGTVLASGQPALPFIVQGSVFGPQPPDAVIEAINTADGGTGIFARGGAGNAEFGGVGVIVVGGDGNVFPAGPGLRGFGGRNLSSADGGDGLQGFGGLGSGAGNRGGNGLVAGGGGGINGATDGLAGIFLGDVQVSGNLSKSGGSFKIDHPLDPENKYLYHSFVESPDMMNIYNGNITTDQNGEAVVTLPDWFQALNRDFRYQLTVVGQFAQAIIASKVKGNRFTIRTSAPGVEVSWQVTGIRQDAYANAHRIPVEQDKPEAERGSYLHPDAFNQPEERSVMWALEPELMQRVKAARASKVEELKQGAPAINQ